MHSARLFLSLFFAYLFASLSFYPTNSDEGVCIVHFRHRLTKEENVTKVCSLQNQRCEKALFCFELWAHSAVWVNVFWSGQYFSCGCVLPECLSLLELPGYCKATWNDSWVWQMSGTAGYVLDYPKSLDNAVIHHCPNYLCIDCRSLCDSTVMANYPGYLWYLLYNGLEV